MYDVLVTCHIFVCTGVALYRIGANMYCHIFLGVVVIRIKLVVASGVAGLACSLASVCTCHKKASLDPSGTGSG